MEHAAFIERHILAKCSRISHNIGFTDDAGKVQHALRTGAWSEPALKRHLNGEAPLSIRLAKSPEATHLACLDFDFKEGDDITEVEFRAKVLEVINVLRGKNFHPKMFLSRGGKGVNVWMRWDGEQSVRDVRGALLTALDSCGLKEGNGHVANGEVEIYPAEWSFTDDETPRCIALPLFGDRSMLNDAFTPIPLPNTWTRSRNPDPYSHETEESDEAFPDQLYDESVVADALKQVPHNEDFSLWLRIGYALKRAFGDDGFELWDEWSADSDQYQGEDSLRDYWDRHLKLKSKNKPISVGTIIHLARENGWTPPAGLSFSFTDLGMARMMSEMFRDTLQWCSTTGDWYHFSDRVWRLDEGRVYVRRKMFRVLADIQARARKLKQGGNELGDLMHAFALRYENANDLSRAIKSAEALPEMTLRLQDFDSDPSRVLTKDGKVLHFLTEKPWIEIEENSPDFKFTKALGVTFDRNASCPKWKEWQAELYPDEDVRYFVKRMAGAALGGHGNKVKRVPFLFGESGDNGKTAFLRVLYHVFGDYGTSANAEMFAETGRGNDPARPRSDLVALRGSRFVMVPEVSSQAELDEATFRNFTGGEYRKARQLHQAQMEWEPVEMYWLAGNSKPRINSNLNATFNRFGLIEMDWECPVERQKEEFDRELVKEEGPGILSWLISGWMGYRHNGREIPDVMREWVRGYQKEEDAVHHFKVQFLVPDAEARTPLIEVWTRFEKWHRDKFFREPAYKARTLKARLEKYDVEFLNPNKEGVVLVGWRFGSAKDAESDTSWLAEFVSRYIADDKSLPGENLAATSILKLASRLGVALPTNDVKELGGELKKMFMIEGEAGDAPGFFIIHLDDGIEFHRWELDKGNRYMIMTPDSGAY